MSVAVVPVCHKILLKLPAVEWSDQHFGVRLPLVLFKKHTHNCNNIILYTLSARHLPILLFGRRFSDSWRGIPWIRVQWSTSDLGRTHESRVRNKLCRPAPNNDWTPDTQGTASRSKIAGMRPHISSRCCGEMCEYLRSYGFINEKILIYDRKKLWNKRNIYIFII